MAPAGKRSRLSIFHPDPLTTSKISRSNLWMPVFAWGGRNYIIETTLLITFVSSRFTIIDRRSEKSVEAAPPSALPPQSTVDVALPDLDFLDHNLADLSDMDNDQFANSPPFPVDDHENSTGPDCVNAYSFGNCLNDDPLQLAASYTGSSSSYQKNTTTSSANASRRSSQISFSKELASSSNSCPLTRLGSQVPSLGTPNTITFAAGNNSNSDGTGNGNSNSSNSNSNNSCPLTRLGSQIPSRTTWNTMTLPTDKNSNSGLNDPPIAADHDPMPDIRPTSRSCNSHLTISPPSNLPTPTHLQVQEPQYTYPTHPTSATASAPEPDLTNCEWPDLPSPPMSTAQSDNMRREGGAGSGGGNGSGSGTPGQSTRTTITLEGAEPEVIMNVMKVLVGSNTKVRFETNWVGGCPEGERGKREGKGLGNMEVDGWDQMTRDEGCSSQNIAEEEWESGPGLPDESGMERPFSTTTYPSNWQSCILAKK